MDREFAKQYFRMVDWWARRGFGRIGFIGSPNGMTAGQAALVREIFLASKTYVPVMQFHHCDRVGADEEAHTIAVELKLVTVSHPHTAALYRARLMSNDVRPAWPALRATLDVVEETELIIAAPFPGAEAMMVDTWDMVFEARKRKKGVLIIAPEIRVATA